MNKELQTIGIWVKASDELPPVKQQVVIKQSNGCVYQDHTHVGWDSQVTDYEWLKLTTAIVLSKEEWDGMQKWQDEVKIFLNDLTSALSPTDDWVEDANKLLSQIK